MGALGLVFLLVVLGQSLAEEEWLIQALAVAGWALWLVFVAEFALRASTARDKSRFWAQHWWQMIFLVVPFLRFTRAFALLRLARVGSVVSAAVRGSRSAGRLLTGRVAWLAVVTAVWYWRLVSSFTSWARTAPTPRRCTMRPWPRQPESRCPRTTALPAFLRCSSRCIRWQCSRPSLAQRVRSSSSITHRAVFPPPRRQIHLNAGNPPSADGATACRQDVVSVV